MFNSISIFLRSYDLSVIFWKIKCKIFNIKIPKIREWQTPFLNKAGIEIGGPSSIFTNNGYLSLYKAIKSLDGVNFSNSTIWEGKISESMPFKYANREGLQYICEGSKLSRIKNEQYDFVLSCNNLEHLANPISAILEWRRVIKKDGYVLLILPNKKSNFDHKRSITLMSHLIDDYKNNIDETDLTHLEEILTHHDLSKDPQAGDFNNFKKRCLNNFENRCLHHHVFNEGLLAEILDYCEMTTLMKYTNKTDIFVLARK